MFKQYSRVIVVFILITASSSCSSGAKSEFADLGHPVYSFDKTLDLRDVALTDSAMEGTWLSEGYGYLLDINKKGSKLFDVSSSSCIPSHKFPSSLMEIENHYSVKSEPTLQKLVLKKRTDFNTLVFNRISALPLSCKLPIDSDNPELNFQILWEQFNEHYAFFESRNVDWNQIYKEFKEKVTQDTDNQTLFDIFAEMIMLLNDSHVSVHSPNRAVWSGKELDDLDSRLQQLEKIIESDYLIGKPKTSAADTLLWGNLEHDIGYLRVSRMESFGYVGNVLAGETVSGFKALNKGLLEAMSDLGGKKSIIIDVRRNTGGEDRASLLITEYFTEVKKRVFNKKARDGDAYSAVTSVYVYPVSTGAYSRPVVLLTSPLTFSAAEIFTMSMMSLPHVTLLGQNTGGGFSDPLKKSLPNGWSVNLSNEIYLTVDGKSYEGDGIPPTIRTRLPVREDLESHADITLEKAIQFLSNPGSLKNHTVQ